MFGWHRIASGNPVKGGFSPQVHRYWSAEQILAFQQQEGSLLMGSVAAKAVHLAEVPFMLVK